MGQLMTAETQTYQVVGCVALLIAVYVMHMYRLFGISNTANNTTVAVTRNNIYCYLPVLRKKVSPSLLCILYTILPVPALLLMPPLFIVFRIVQPVFRTKMPRGWSNRRIAHLTHTGTHTCFALFLSVFSQERKAVCTVFAPGGNLSVAADARSSVSSQNCVDSNGGNAKLARDCMPVLKFSVRLQNAALALLGCGGTGRHSNDPLCCDANDSSIIARSYTAVNIPH